MFLAAPTTEFRTVGQGLFSSRFQLLDPLSSTHKDSVPRVTPSKSVRMEFTASCTQCLRPSSCSSRTALTESSERNSSSHTSPSVVSVKQCHVPSMKPDTQTLMPDVIIVAPHQRPMPRPTRVPPSLDHCFVHTNRRHVSQVLSPLPSGRLFIG